MKNQLRILAMSIITAGTMTACANIPSLNNGDTATQSQASKAYFMDILYLQDGKTVADAETYFSRVEPVVAKHGLKRSTLPFLVTKVMAGSIEPDLVNVWTVGDSENTFSDIFEDENYLKNVEFRNSIFDMSKSHMFMMAPTR